MIKVALLTRHFLPDLFHCYNLCWIFNDLMYWWIMQYFNRMISKSHPQKKTSSSFWSEHNSCTSEAASSPLLQHGSSRARWPLPCPFSLAKSALLFSLKGKRRTTFSAFSCPNTTAVYHLCGYFFMGELIQAKIIIIIIIFIYLFIFLEVSGTLLQGHFFLEVTLGSC